MTLDSDLNAVITKIPTGGSQVSIWDQTDYPLNSITVKNDTRLTIRTDGGIEDPVVIFFSLLFLQLLQSLDCLVCIFPLIVLVFRFLQSCLYCYKFLWYYGF
jgi:hypothetical protein